MPESGRSLALWFPRDAQSAFTLDYQLPTPDPAVVESYQLAIDPYTAQVKGVRLMEDPRRPWAGPFIWVMVRLHYQLWLNSLGETTVGIIALFLLFSVLTGLILWWPLTGKFRQALTIKRGASSERLNFDLHKIFGFYSAIVLLVLLVSGVQMIFPDNFQALVELFSPVMDQWPDSKSSPHTGGIPLRPSEAAALAEAMYPDREFIYLSLPQGPEGVYTIGKRPPGDVREHMTHRRVTLDQYNGAFLSRHDIAENTTGDSFIYWLYPLHSGEAFGVTGKIIILISGFVPLVLYVTGFIRWRQKKRSENHHVVRHTSTVSA